MSISFRDSVRFTDLIWTSSIKIRRHCRIAASFSTDRQLAGLKWSWLTLSDRQSRSLISADVIFDFRFSPFWLSKSSPNSASETHDYILRGLFQQRSHQAKSNQFSAAPRSSTVHHLDHDRIRFGLKPLPTHPVRRRQQFAIVDTVTALQEDLHHSLPLGYPPYICPSFQQHLDR